MAQSAYYHQLGIGEKFFYGNENKVYQKVKPVMKNCCKQLYNSVGIDNPEIDRIIVPPNVSVQLYEEAPPGAT